MHYKTTENKNALSETHLTCLHQSVKWYRYTVCLRFSQIKNHDGQALQLLLRDDSHCSQHTVTESGIIAARFDWHIISGKNIHCMRNDAHTPIYMLHEPMGVCLWCTYIHIQATSERLQHTRQLKKKKTDWQILFLRHGVLSIHKIHQLYIKTTI